MWTFMIKSVFLYSDEAISMTIPWPLDKCSLAASFKILYFVILRYVEYGLFGSNLVVTRSWKRVDIDSLAFSIKRLSEIPMN